jgi:hypothetical protein
MLNAMVAACALMQRNWLLSNCLHKRLPVHPQDLTVNSNLAERVKPAPKKRSESMEHWRLVFTDRCLESLFCKSFRPASLHLFNRDPERGL